MILNSGLDAACSGDAAAGSGRAPDEAWPIMCRWVQYAAFGTGSAAPDPTDTVLGAQVGSRSNNRGGFANALSTGLDDTNDIIWCEATFTRVFSIASNVNATEWGLSAASTGNLSVRELFRADPLDNGSTPITLTLEGGDELQLVVTLRVQADWEYASKSFVITGTAGNDTAGTHTGDATASSGNATNDASVQDTLAILWPGGGVASDRDQIMALTADQSGKSKSDQLDTAGSVSVSAAAASYTPGNFYRDWSATFGTSTANFDHRAWLYGTAGTASGASGTRGLRLILTDPVKLTKTSAQQLVLTVRKSISRL